jgi:hypothetical protein
MCVKIRESIEGPYQSCEQRLITAPRTGTWTIDLVRLSHVSASQRSSAVGGKRCSPPSSCQETRERSGINEFLRLASYRCRGRSRTFAVSSLPITLSLCATARSKDCHASCVTPVSLLTEEACVLRPCWSPRHPRARDDPSKCSCTDKRGSSHRLMRPRIVFGMIRPLPPVWFLLRHELPALSARALWFGLPATELAD